MEVIKGITICKGCIIGKTLVAEPGIKTEKTLLQTLSKEFYDLDIDDVGTMEALKKDLDQKKLTEQDISAEIKKFDQAIQSSGQNLIEAKEKLKKTISEKFSEIIDFQILALKDTNIFDKIIRIIKNYRISAYLAASIVFNERIELLKKNRNEKFKNRIYDLVDLYNRLVAYLKPSGLPDTIPEKSSGEHSLIMITRNLFPTDIADMDFNRVKGIVSRKGSMESHTSILIKSIKIPYLIDADQDLSSIKNNHTAILDAHLGILIIDPDLATLKKYQDYCSPVINASAKSAERLRTKCPVMANINSTNEAMEAMEMGVEGIGLFRTELSILNGDMGLTLDKQYQNYKRILTAYQKLPVTLRMLDLSGDKQALINLLYKQSFKREEIKPRIDKILKMQLKAMLMASVYGNLTISLPMVSKPEDIFNFKTMLGQVQETLSHEGIKFKKDIPVIAMIETPGAVFSLDYILSHTSSISIGTNDLFSLSFATSRFNNMPSDKESFLYQPTLEMLHYIISRAQKQKKQVAICGEVASHPYFIPLLVGLGISSFSVGLRNYYRVKKILESTEPKAANRLARKALKLDTKDQIEELLKDSKKKSR
ncbi:MAG: putative PEP-binding protein [Actinomycetota bacterium]|nr:putative PEP-binding protein [Actinomycetota bacterium]